jgi:uncharacterized protein (TIGR03663 family)
MAKRVGFAAGLLLIAALALALRLPNLEQRPMHCDEAVHAVKFNELWTTGVYRYDPHEYHGPTLYYATLPVVWLSGTEDFNATTEATYRLVPVVFSLLLILLLRLLRDDLGYGATLVAGLLTAVSPAFVFYGRYYIQETLLVCFTFAAMIGGWRYVRRPQVGWAILAGLAVGFMHATKETCIIAWGCMGVAGLITWRWERRWRRRVDLPSRTRGGATLVDAPASAVDGPATAVEAPVEAIVCRVKVWHLLAAVMAAAVVSVGLYSAGGQYFAGVADSWRTYGNYFERAGGAGLHDHPWWYYLRMLAYTKYVPGPWWSEALILGLALIGVVVAFVGRRGASDRGVPLVRFVAIYALLMTVVYSALPYKTPWCMLGFLHGMILLAGVGAVGLLRAVRWRGPRFVVAALLAVGVIHLARQAEAGAQRFAADPRNPYVYAHPTNDVLRLDRRVHELADLHPDGKAMLIKVTSPDYWPLPWYFRDLDRVWWDAPVRLASDAEEPAQTGEADDREGAVAPTELRPAVVIALPEQAVSEAAAGYVSSFYGLRPDVAILVYIEPELWERFLDVQRAKTATANPAAANPVTADD